MKFCEKPNSIVSKIFAINDLDDEDRIKYYNYMKNLNENKELYVSYKQKTYNGNNYGRYYPSEFNSTFMKTKIRATLFENDYDLDLVNCHFTLLYGLYKKYKTSTDEDVLHLHDYVYNRQEVIDRFGLTDEIIAIHNSIKKSNLSKNDIIKHLFTIILYGGTIQTFNNEYPCLKHHLKIPDTFKKFKKEIKNITELLVNQEIYNKMVTDIKHEYENPTEGTKKKYHNGVGLSFILQNEENKYIQTCLKTISKNKNLKVTTYNFDGFQIRFNDGLKNDENTKEINEWLDIINEQINPMKLVWKPFKNKYSKQEIKDIDMRFVRLFDFTEQTNHIAFSHILKYFINDTILKSKNGYYLYEKGYWRKVDLDVIRGLIDNKVYTYIQDKIYKIYPVKNRDINSFIKNIRNWCGTNSNIKNSMEIIFNQKCDNSIKFDEKPHLLNATNGTFNFNTNKLQDHNPLDYLTKCINYDINENQINQENMKLTRDFFGDWFYVNNIDKNEMDEVINSLLYQLGKSLNGNNHIEKAIVLLGRLSRNGKSTMISMLRNILNSYFGMLPLSYFTQVEMNPDKPSSVLLAVKGCRLIDVGEADTGSQNIFINPKPFKAWTGLDLHRARDLYGKKEDFEEFTPQGILLFACNENIRFSTECNALSNRLMYYKFNCWFGDETMAGWDATLPYCKKINNDFKFKMTDDKLLSTILHGLIYASQQTEQKYGKIMLEWNNECIGEIDSIRVWCENNFIIDKSTFNMDTDSFIINNFPNIEGKKRMITLDSMFHLYDKNNDTGYSKKNFNKRVAVIYNNIYNPKSKTKIFGNKLNYIPYLRYTAYDDDNDDNDDNDNDELVEVVNVNKPKTKMIRIKKKLIRTEEKNNIEETKNEIYM